MSLLRNLRADVRRRVTRHLRHTPIAVCECNGWDDFLIHALCPEAVRVPIAPGESGLRVSGAIGRAAKVVLMHIDASRTDGFLGEEAAFFDGLVTRGVTPLNARATDVRKRTLHERCAALGLPSAATPREGPPDEQVIIKTTLNAAGVPERRLLARGGAASERFKHDLNGEIRDPDGYRICQRQEVPAAAWTDPTLAIERYIDNPEGAFYRVYGLGPATAVAQIWTDLQIKKLALPARRRAYFFFWNVSGDNVALNDATDDVVHAVSVARRVSVAMATEFHATDCVMDAGGSIVPIDVNKTPFWGRAVVRPGVLEHLRLGFEYLVAGGPVS